MTNCEKHLRGMYAAIVAAETVDEVAAFFHPDAEQVEYPSLMRPSGHRRSLSEMGEGFEVGRKLLLEQHYEVLNVIEAGDRVAVQLTWTATLAVDLPDAPAGSVLTSHVAAFYEFKGGLVLRQSSYDCYEPLVSV